MRIRSKQIDQAQQLDLELALSADELNGLLRGYEGYEATAPARASLRLRTADKAYALTGSLVASLSAPCRRCLSPCPSEVDLSLELRLLPATLQPASNEEVELSPEDCDTHFFHDDEIDLHEILRESLLVELEPYRQCSEACAGLCSGCGANLNLEPCRCTPVEGDPRWQELLRLKRSPS